MCVFFCLNGNSLFRIYISLNIFVCSFDRFPPVIFIIFPPRSEPAFHSGGQPYDVSRMLHRLRKFNLFYFFVIKLTCNVIVMAEVENYFFCIFSEPNLVGFCYSLFDSGPSIVAARIVLFFLTAPTRFGRTVDCKRLL